MRIEYYTREGTKVLAEVVDNDDYWGACEYGFSRLEALAVEGVEEYQVFEDEEAPIPSERL